jgi:glycosidase
VHRADWSRKAVVYELNTRQFTKEGNFKAVLPRIPELKHLGVGIVWFMPIHPIGQEQRKGRLGSPYAVRDYYGINPEFGNLDDFKALVHSIHDQDMHVIIDLVINHTAWDNPLVKEHPDWYVHDATGKIVSPFDWTDTVKLNYQNPELREYIIKMMEHWVRDVGVDGFRCDVAGEVPTAFWNEARARLDRIRPVFMLAEAEKPELLVEAFDSDYDSQLFRTFDDIAHGKANAEAVDAQVVHDRNTYPGGSRRLLFSTNHDQNSWLDSDIHRLGPLGSEAFADLIFTLPGRPLIYNGQEVGNARKLAFFERDPLVWPEDSDRRRHFEHLTRLYGQEIELQTGTYTRLGTDAPKQVLAFQRRSPASESLVVVANLSATPVKTLVQWPFPTDRLHELDLDGHAPGTDPPPGKPSVQPQVDLGPWQVRVYSTRE